MAQISPPKKENLIAEHAAIKIKELLGFPNGELFSKVVEIIYKEAIKIYGETK